MGLRSCACMIYRSKEEEREKEIQEKREQGNKGRATYENEKREKKTEENMINSPLELF